MTEQGLVRIGEVLPDRPRGAGNPVGAYLASLASPHSRRRMRIALEKAAEVLGYELDGLPWEDLRPSHLEYMRTAIAGEQSRASANLALTAMKQVMLRAWRDFELVDAERYTRIMTVKGAPKRGEDVLTGREITPGEIAAMSAVCSQDQTAVGARDAAILALAVSGGLRRSELAGLQVGDLDDDGEQITVTVLGKGRKRRTVILDNGAADALRDWIRIRGDSPGALFWSGRKGGRLTRGHGMSAQAIYDVLLRRAAEAGISKALTPHDFRRTFISNGLDVADAVTVAKLAGHSNVSTTMRYDRRGDRAKRAAAASLHFPYQRRAVLV